MVIGLALGSGSSRGWAHIGVIEALVELGLSPGIICGTSIGSVVGAAFAAGNMDKLKQGVSALSPLSLASYFNIHPTFNGFVHQEKMQRFFESYVTDRDSLIEDLPLRYAAVATELETGREVWIKKGSVLQAIWASAALPAFFPPVQHKDKWLLDGGLVNPVPVSACRALGADVVIAVNLHGDLMGGKPQKNGDKKSADAHGGIVAKVAGAVKGYAQQIIKSDERSAAPNMFETMASSINIFQDRITKSRMAGDPPDIMLAPRLAHIKLLEFHRGQEAMEEGRQCVRRMMPAIETLLAEL